MRERDGMEGERMEGEGEDKMNAGEAIKEWREAMKARRER